jgi:hypothetical protein
MKGTNIPGIKGNKKVITGERNMKQKMPQLPIDE